MVNKNNRDRALQIKDFQAHLHNLDTNTNWLAKRSKRMSATTETRLRTENQDTLRALMVDGVGMDDIYNLLYFYEKRAEGVAPNPAELSIEETELLCLSQYHPKY